MNSLRRGLLAALPVGLVLASAARAGTTDLAVSCDTAVTPAVRRAAEAFRWQTGVRVRLFPTMPALLVPQLERDIQNDIIVTRTGTLDLAEQKGLVKPGGRTGSWRDRLVLATAAVPAGPEGSFAVPDVTPASEVDGHAVLKAMGLAPAQVLGVLDTGTVAAMLISGQVREGLVFQSDIAANPGLVATGTVPDKASDPVLYAATVTNLAYRGDPAAFVAYLNGAAAMLDAGLERVA